MMSERFNNEAAEVMRAADAEARCLKHEYIGTEHILLGLLNVETSRGAQVLTDLAVDVRRIREQMEKLIQLGGQSVTRRPLPVTPRAKKVLEFAICESHDLNHSYVGTEHILLGLIREDMGVAAQLLMNAGLSYAGIREAVLRLVPRPDENGDSVAS
jgi:ATP-dependent Clp protease ATP-binding subunit ClpC